MFQRRFSLSFSLQVTVTFFFYKELHQMALEIQNKTSNTVSIKKNYFFWSEVNYDFKLREDEKKLLSLHLSPSYKLFFSASK